MTNNTPEALVELASDSEIKALWIQHGGAQHGPMVEQYYIEEQAFYRFARALLALRTHPTRPSVQGEGVGLVTPAELIGAQDLDRDSGGGFCRATYWETRARQLSTECAGLRLAFAEHEQTVQRLRALSPPPTGQCAESAQESGEPSDEAKIISYDHAHEDAGEEGK